MNNAAETNEESNGVKGFCREFTVCWQAMSDKWLFFGLLAAWVALFHFIGNSSFGYINTPSLFGWLGDIYMSKNTDDAHGILIPPVVLALFWWKRKTLLTIPQSVWTPGIFLLLAGALLHVAGYVIQQPRVSVVGFLVGAYGLIGLAWGARWMKASFFPFVFFVFCIPVGGVIESITFPLRLFSTWITHLIISGMLGASVVRQGTQLTNASNGYAYDVSAACSGIRSLISLLALTTIYGMMTFKTPWKRLVTILSAVPLAIFCNILRLLAIIMTAELFGQKAGDFVHEWSGFLTYAVALGCMLWLGHLIREPKDQDEKSAA